MHRHALFYVAALVLAGCSAASAGSAAATTQESTARPADCEQNLCDVDYDTCKASETDRCAECNSTCATIDYQFVVQCLDTCSDICSSPSTSTCGTWRDGCVTTHRNAVCTDGMDPNDLPKSPDWIWSFHSPAEAHQGACTASELTQFETACLGAKSSASACEAFATAHPHCGRCILTDVTAEAWGPLVIDSSGDSWLNSEGCIARVAGDESCARKLYEANTCLSGCSGATDRDTCLEFARANECRYKVTAAESCAAELGVDNSPEYAPCGPALGEATEEIIMGIIGLFCGSP
jgi:hypothetical protein